MTGLEGQHPPGARMGHPDIKDPQDTSHQGTRSQVAEQVMLFLCIP